MTPPVTAPSSTLSTRWTHQDAAFEFVQMLWESGRHGAMLAMWMGTGKSRVAVDLACSLAAELVLILCPLRVIEVWQAQFARFAPGEYHFGALDQLVGTVREKTQHARDLVVWARGRRKPLVLAINYESARTEPFASWALGRPWPLVICDESHRLKQPSGRTARFAAKLGLHAARRLALTGTPMPHMPIDIWGQFRFLDPTILDPTFGSFQLRYTIKGGYKGKQIVGFRDLDELYARFRQITFQVDASVLDLPPELDQVLSTELTAEGARIYREMERDMVTWIKSSPIPVTAANAMVRLLRLQQITGGSLPGATGQTTTIDTAKEDLLVDFLNDLEPAEPVVVFAWFRSDLEAIHRAALRTLRLSAELSGARDGLADWQHGGNRYPTVLAVQIQAGGVGIDLTRARLAVYYSTGFSLANYLQSRARIRRPPQQRPCVFYHLQIRNSIDEYVLGAIERRQDLIESVLNDYRQQGELKNVLAHHRQS